MQFALPQLALVCSADFIEGFMVSLVFVVRRGKSPCACRRTRYILSGKCYTVYRPVVCIASALILLLVVWAGPVQNSSATRSLFSIMPAWAPVDTAFATVRCRVVLSPQA